MKNKLAILTLALIVSLSGIGCAKETVKDQVSVIDEIEIEVNNYSAYERNNGDTINYIDESLLQDNQVCIYINNFATIIDTTSETMELDTTQLSTEMDNIFYVKNANGYEITINHLELHENEKLPISLEALNQENKIEIMLHKSKEDSDEVDQHLFFLNTIHSQVNYTSYGENKEDVFYYMDYNDAAVKTNNKGEAVFYKYTKFIRDFRRNEIDGEVYYTYLERANEEDYDNIDVTGCQHMRLIVLDENYNVVDRVDYLETNNGIEERHSIENHEYQMLALGHYIVSSYTAMEVDNIPEELLITEGENITAQIIQEDQLVEEVETEETEATVEEVKTGKVAAAIFQEIKDGELVFEFNSTNYPELYEYSTDRNFFGEEEHQDYIHMNSVFIDPKDENYIVSLRSLDAVIKLDRKTGEIIWILGGEGDMFGLKETYQFSRQHFATISSLGTLTLYDNGVSSEQSRILEFTLDEKNLKIEKVEEHQIDGYYGNIRGSVLRTNETENEFITSWGHTQDNKAIITHYNFSTDKRIIEFYDNSNKNSRNYRSRIYNN